MRLVRTVNAKHISITHSPPRLQVKFGYEPAPNKTYTKSTGTHSKRILLQSSKDYADYTDSRTGLIRLKPQICVTGVICGSLLELHLLEEAQTLGDLCDRGWRFIFHEI